MGLPIGPTSVETELPENWPNVAGMCRAREELSRERRENVLHGGEWGFKKYLIWQITMLPLNVL